MKIAVIGAGWYGCHIALTLKNLGMSVTLYEKEEEPFTKASWNNQNRLHKGFHYARHHGTRVQSKEGFDRFLETYPTLTHPIENNVYAVPKYSSLIDFKTYCSIMMSSGVDFEILKKFPFEGVHLSDIEGMIDTDERLVLRDKAKEYFIDELKDVNCKFGSSLKIIGNDGWRIPIIDGMSYDFIIDCTWGHFDPKALGNEYLWEPTLLLYYEPKSEGFPAVTMVDGELCSLYPTDDGRFTLSSVKHTPLSRHRCESPEQAQAILKKLKKKDITVIRKYMEREISQFFPDFRQHFRFSDVQLSMKTKPIGANDSRACAVKQNGQNFTVLSGKIDTIFHASDQILSGIAKYNS